MRPLSVSSGEALLALRRKRMAEAPPFLRGGFRPFFLGGAAWALVAIALWLLALATGQSPSPLADALSWHRHEMLFGFVGAIIAGFLLTAVPNWTGRLPVAGGPLALLFGWWLAGRIAMLVPGLSPTLVAVIDGSFYLGLAAIMAREVVLAGNRNLPVVGLVALLGVADLSDHAAIAGRIADPAVAVRWAIVLVVVLISLIGGRIIPSFTRNWLQRNRPNSTFPTQPGRFDMLAIAVTALALGCWAIVPDARWPGGLLATATILQAIRLVRWRGLRCARDPLVFILHVGYAWVPVGLALLAGVASGAAIPQSAAVHALTTGAMATMILAVMTRASLGHTGRELRAGGRTFAIYVVITIAAVLRVAASLGVGDYRLLMHGSGLFWIAAFGLFLLAYGPILFGPRIDGRV